MNVISVDELKLKMDKGEKLNLIDVREPHACSCAIGNRNWHPLKIAAVFAS
jgi:rhodanese-related sulfurtransferase